MLTLGLASAGSADDELQDELSGMDGRVGAAERDAAYARAARSAALSGDPRAREYAEKIKDDYLRKRVLAFVDFAALRVAINKNNVEEAARLARSGDFQGLQRVWAYTEVARLAKVAAPVRALELLGDALTEARRFDNAAPERAYALTAIATRMIEIDRPRGWEVMAEAIKAANSVNGFTGEEGKIETRLNTSDRISILKADAPAFNVAGIFTTLAKDDLQRAISLAKGFEGDYPRANAILAIAKSVMSRKHPGTTNVRP